MTRKQAKRRKQKKTRQIKLPTFPWKRIAAVTFAIAVVLLSYRFSAEMLDQPITSISIEGPFQRVSALSIEEAISDQLNTGFLSANLKLIQDRVKSLPWIDQAAVGRRWPGTLEISVTEQVPAAIWGERGLLNTRGDLFVTDARHVPAELPRLSGPDGQSAVVAERYLAMREKLIASGLDLRQVKLDARGAWALQLSNGVDVRLGRRDIDVRSQLFLDVAANIISSREGEIEFVDMRYSNGFTIGWKTGARSPVADPDSVDAGMVAGL